jgi:hypothetical protein
LALFQYLQVAALLFFDENKFRFFTDEIPIFSVKSPQQEPKNESGKFVGVFEAFRRLCQAHGRF